MTAEPDPRAGKRSRQSGYASQRDIGRAIRAAKKSGFTVSALEVSPEGHIRLFESGDISSTGRGDFDLWKDEL